MRQQLMDSSNKLLLWIHTQASNPIFNLFRHQRHIEVTPTHTSFYTNTSDTIVRSKNLYIISKTGVLRMLVTAKVANFCITYVRIDLFSILMAQMLILFVFSVLMQAVTTLNIYLYSVLLFVWVRFQKWVRLIIT